MFKTTIVCPAWDRPDCLKKWLGHVWEYKSEDAMLCVVNNGSGQKLKDVCERYILANGFTYIELSENVGIPKALNIGIKYAYKSGILITTEDDNFIYTDEFDKKILDIFDNNRDCGMIITEHFEDRLSEVKSIHETHEYKITELTEHTLGQLKAFSPDFKEKIGYFCEDYGMYGYEDSDILLRVANTGLKIFKISKGVVLCAHGRVDERGDFLPSLAGNRLQGGGIERLVEKGLVRPDELKKNYHLLPAHGYIYKLGKKIYQGYNEKNDKYIVEIKKND